jgi:protein-disulfide isomerase
MNQRLIVVVAALAAIVVFVAGAVFYNSQKEVAVRPKPTETTLIRQHSQTVGPEDAPVTVVEFFDPSCEACRYFHPIMKQVLAQYPEDVRLVLRYAPFHPGSDEAVRLLESSAIQGKFAVVLDALFENQPEWAAHGQPNLKRAWEIAGEAGLNLMKARLDSVKPDVDNVLKMDVADGQANSVEQTPTFYVNGKRLLNFSEQGLRDLIKNEVDQSKNKT